MTTVPPSEAKLVQEKLNRVNDRYGNVSSAARDHGEGLLALSKKLSDFEKEVDDFEDWLLPDLETLESEALMKQEPANTANTLKVCFNPLNTILSHSSRLHTEPTGYLRQWVKRCLGIAVVMQIGLYTQNIFPRFIKN